MANKGETNIPLSNLLEKIGSFSQTNTEKIGPTVGEERNGIINHPEERQRGLIQDNFVIRHDPAGRGNIQFSKE